MKEALYDFLLFMRTKYKLYCGGYILILSHEIIVMRTASSRVSGKQGQELS